MDLIKWTVMNNKIDLGAVHGNRVLSSKVILLPQTYLAVIF